MPSPLQRNRDFFDQLFTCVVKSRFRAVAAESAARKLTILPGSCTAARCRLVANGHAMVLMASGMASDHPRIQLAQLPARDSKRRIVVRTLHFDPSRGWIDNRRGVPVGDLTTWLDARIARFLKWAAKDKLPAPKDGQRSVALTSI